MSEQIYNEKAGMNPALFDRPFFEVTLPIMATIIAGVWAMISTNNRRLDDIIKWLERIEGKLEDHQDLHLL